MKISHPTFKKDTSEKMLDLYQISLYIVYQRIKEE